MKNRRIDLKSDIVFKFVFGEDVEESRLALKDLLSSYLKKEIHQVRIANSEPVSSYKKQKNIRLDIHVTFNDGEQADVEMQVAGTRDTIIPRMLYYKNRLFVSQPIKGELYPRLKATYLILIANFVLFEEREEELHQFEFRDSQGRGLGEGGELDQMIIVELPKVKEKEIQEMSAAECWNYFLRYYENEQKGGIIKAIKEKQEGIAMAEKRLEEVSEEQLEYIRQYAKEREELDEKWRKAELMEERYQEGLSTGLNKGLAEGKSKGLVEGKAKGLVEGRIEIIEKLLETMSIQECAKLLHMEEADINQLI